MTTYNAFPLTGEKISELASVTPAPAQSLEVDNAGASAKVSVSALRAYINALQTWNEIQDKPTGFAPAPHGHDFSEITVANAAAARAALGLERLDLALTLSNSFTAFEASNRLIIDPAAKMATILFAVARASFPGFGTTVCSWSNAYTPAYPTSWVGTAVQGTPSFVTFPLRLYVDGPALKWHLLNANGATNLAYAIGQVSFPYL